MFDHDQCLYAFRTRVLDLSHGLWNLGLYASDFLTLPINLARVTGNSSGLHSVGYPFQDWPIHPLLDRKGQPHLTARSDVLAI